MKYHSPEFTTVVNGFEPSLPNAKCLANESLNRNGHRELLVRAKYCCAGLPLSSVYVGSNPAAGAIGNSGAAYFSDEISLPGEMVLNSQ